MPTLDETRAWVRELFDGVTDKGGKPYAEHCFRVEAGLPADVDDDTRHAALLHDVLEDTATSVFDLSRRGYSGKTVSFVSCLTKQPSETYSAYISFVAGLCDLEVLQIKLSDNRDNSAPERLATLPNAVRAKLERKYEEAREVLEPALEQAVAFRERRSALSNTFKKEG